jgi:hypothetical protein
MRHINFFVDGGTLRSLDGFNYGNRLDYLLVGDSTATLKSFETQKLFKNYANYTTPNFPVMDMELHKVLERVAGLVDKVYLFPSTELNGVLRKQEIFDNEDKLVSKSLLSFEGEDRGSYYQKQYLRATYEEADRLRQGYLKLIRYFVGNYPNLQVVPVLNRFLEPRIPQYFKAYSELKDNPRVIDLDWLDPSQRDLWLDSYGHLSDKGWSLLKEKL